MASAFNPDDLAGIAAKAATFWDHSPGGGTTGYPPPSPAASSARIDAWLNQWIATVAQDDEAAFRRRLAFDRHGMESVRSLLAEPSVLPELPLWTTILDEVLNARSESPHSPDIAFRSAVTQCLIRDAPVPFEDILIPFVAVGRDRVSAASSGRYRRLRDAVCGEFERDLLKILSELSGRVLLVEFRTCLATRQLRCDPIAPSGAPADPQCNYRAFVARMLDGDWASIFIEYPALARLLAGAVLNWVEATAELVGRFEQDAAQIAQRFFPDEAPLEIAAVQPGLSDRHHAGRTVVALTLASGSRLIYKPKPLALETAYGRLVEELMAHGWPIELRAPRSLDCGNYGWQEFIESRPCRSEGEVSDFYRRLGALLALAYALNGIDFHFENIIACGGFPIAVDLETLFHPNIAEPDDDQDPVASRLKQSVLRADILPNPVRVHDHYRDISAIGSTEAPDVEMLRWIDINTDRMSLARAAAPMPRADHLPTLQGQPLDPRSYLSDITDGFSAAYRSLIAQRQVLLRSDGRLRDVFRCHGRFIFRATAFYQSLLNRSLHPDRLRHGTDLGIQLDVLSRKLIGAADKPASWPLVRDEAKALLNGDIPKFLARGDATALMLNCGDTLDGFFPRSAWADVQAKLKSLDEADLAFQVRLIGATMDADAMREDVDPSQTMAERHQNTTARERPAALSRDVLQVHAVDLGRAIRDNAIGGPNGEPGWLVLNYVPEARRFALQPIGLDLYNGRCGIALFLAALARCAPGEGFETLCMAAVAPVRRWLARADATEIRRLGLGGFTGLGGVIYALARIATLIDDRPLLAEAVRAAALVDDDQIRAETRLDVLSGTAGAVLALLTLAELTGAPGPLDAAIRCGHHLMARREIAPGGTRTWPSFGRRHLTGFSHGAAGFAHALLRLAAATGEQAFVAAAEDAIAFENQDFAPDANNWPDRRAGRSMTGPTGPSFKLAWCTGAPGIALARTADLHLSNAGGLRLHLRSALTATSRAPLLERDHLCCGNLGLTETLLTAGQVLNEATWQAEAHRLASEVVGRSVTEGRFRVSSQTGFFNPTLFQGAAGVGYQLLRLARPDEIPCVLLLA